MTDSAIARLEARDIIGRWAKVNGVECAVYDHDDALVLRCETTVGTDRYGRIHHFQIGPDWKAELPRVLEGLLIGFHESRGDRIVRAPYKILELPLTCGTCGSVDRWEGVTLQWCASCGDAICPTCTPPCQAGLTRCRRCIGEQRTARIVCAGCGKVSQQKFPSFARRPTEDGFTFHDPVCVHRRYALCPSCADHGCPKCGTLEQKT